MKQGALIFAHNSETLNYLKMSLVSARLVKKNLNVPVCIVTDQYSLDQTQIDLSQHVDHVVLIPKPAVDNYRNLNNTRHAFINGSRHSAWSLTPFDRTLLIDSDLLIMSDAYSQYWDSEDFLMCGSMTDLIGNKLSQEEMRVSDHTIRLRWATAVMFTKNEYTKKIFDTVEFVKREYRYFSDLYEFDSRNFRNDIAFSIAAHITNGFKEADIFLPSPLFFTDVDNIIDVVDDQLLILATNGSKNIILPLNGIDIHFLNKKNILENYDKLMELVCLDT